MSLSPERIDATDDAERGDVTSLMVVKAICFTFARRVRVRGAGGEGAVFFLSHCLYRSARDDTMLLLISGWPREVFAMLSMM